MASASAILGLRARGRASARVVGLGRGRPRPLPIRVFNRIGPRAALDEGALLDAAVRRTGLRDFGEETFRPALRRLLVALEEEARLHAWGRWITRQRLVSLLANRLRAERCFQDHPEILEQELCPPLVITGLQRTGTTLLHRLLAAAPGTLAVSAWEALSPAPVAARLLGRDTRPLAAWISQQALRYMAPEFFAIHPVEYDGPEEEVLLLDTAFLSQVPEAMVLVPRYSEWLEGQDQAPAYRALRRLLLLLQWQKPRGRRWVLKTPHHMEWLDHLVAEFPEALIVHTHRDPLVALASLLSMVFHCMRIFSDEVRPEEVGRAWGRKIRRMVERALDFRARHGAERIVDVSYYDLVRDPLGQIEAIYGRCGEALDPALRHAVEARRRASPQHRHGVHRYSLADFGLTEGDVEPGFAEYRRALGIPRERRGRPG